VEGSSHFKESPERLEQWKSARLLASPLARALGTALLALGDHPNTSQEQGGIQLWSTVREVKGVGGMDCLASVVGNDIQQTVGEKLLHTVEGGTASGGLCAAQERGENDALREAIKQQLETIYVDPNDATSPWWTQFRDDPEEINERLHTVARFVQHSSADSFIIVGHSYLFREFAKAFASEDCEGNCAKQFVKEKIPNAGCVALDMTFGEEGPRIVCADAMFGTQFPGQEQTGI